MTEAGWIVKKKEVKQIVEFVKITPQLVKSNQNLREFLLEWIRMLGLKEDLEFFLDVDFRDLYNCEDDD